MPNRERQDGESQGQDGHTPPSSAHLRHRLKPGTMDIFGELREVGFRRVQAAAFGKTLQPELLIQTNMAAITAHDALAQDPARQLVEEVGFQRLEMPHRKAGGTRNVLQRHTLLFALNP